jgi:hypothetical protein
MIFIIKDDVKRRIESHDTLDFMHMHALELERFAHWPCELHMADRILKNDT